MFRRVQTGFALSKSLEEVAKQSLRYILAAKDKTKLKSEGIEFDDGLDHWIDLAVLLTDYEPLTLCTFTADHDQVVQHEWVTFVPPDMFANVTGDQWYEYGILREWHERRKRGMIGNSHLSKIIEDYECRNCLTPSYLSSSQSGSSGAASGEAVDDDEADIDGEEGHENEAEDYDDPE